MPSPENKGYYMNWDIESETDIARLEFEKNETAREIKRVNAMIEDLESIKKTITARIFVLKNINQSLHNKSPIPPINER